MKCNKRFRAMPTAISQVKCPHCYLIFPLDRDKMPNVTFHQHKDVVAFGHDAKGREVAIDKKGKRIDPSQTRYDLKKDPHGWKASGKKVKPLDRKGRPNI